MNENRIDRLEETFGVHDVSPAEFLKASGIGEERIDEVTEAGEIRWMELTLDELEQASPANDDEVLPGSGVCWGDLSDEELQRIADGEDPQAVVRDRLSI